MPYINEPQLNKRQRGAFSIMSAGVLLLALSCLVLVVDSGRLYMEKRHLQKLADTSALAAIAQLPDGNCSADSALAQSAAAGNASEQGFLSSDEQALNSRCVKVETIDGLRRATASATGRAIEVTTRHEVPASIVLRGGSLFNSNLSGTVQLQAIAVAEREEPSAVFSVGSQLLRLDNNKLLGRLLRVVGLNADDLTVLDADGLANAKISPSGLLSLLGVDIGIEQLNVLSPQGLVDLVNTQVGLLGIDRLIDLSLEVVSDSLLKADLEALRLKILKNPILKDIDVQLFGTAESPGLISIASTPEGSIGPALDTQINLGPLLKTSLLIGSSGRGLQIQELNVLGLAKVEAGIVEPPSIGVGPVGTQAYSAQVRLYVGVDTSNLLGGLLAWLTETILGTRINLPIWIDVVTGHGTLEAIDCSVNPPTADILVESDILNACVGKIPDALKWSGSQSCESNLQEDELIKLLHIPVLSGKTHIQGLEYTELVEELAVGETASTSPNALALGNTVQNLVNSLLDLLSGLFRKPNIANNNSDLDYSSAAQKLLISNLATQYLKASAKNGFYDVAAATNLILNGGSERDENGNQVLPPLVDDDWAIEKSIPKTCLLAICPPSSWSNGTFSQAFHAYTSVPYSVLDLLGISTLGKGFSSCSGLLSALLAWNKCVDENLTQLLQDNAAAIHISDSGDGANLANPNTDSVACSGLLCVILQPVLELLKPILNGVGRLLTVVLADVLGVELGRTDVELHALSCGIPKLVR